MGEIVCLPPGQQELGVPLNPLVFSSVKWTQEQDVTESGTTASFQVAVARVAVETQEWMFVEDFPGSSGLSLPTALTGGQPRRGSSSGVGLPGFKPQPCRSPASWLRQVTSHLHA